MFGSRDFERTPEKAFAIRLGCGKVSARELTFQFVAVTLGFAFSIFIFCAWLAVPLVGCLGSLFYEGLQVVGKWDCANLRRHFLLAVLGGSAKAVASMLASVFFWLVILWGFASGWKVRLREFTSPLFARCARRVCKSHRGKDMDIDASKKSVLLFHTEAVPCWSETNYTHWASCNWPATLLASNILGMYQCCSSLLDQASFILAAFSLPAWGNSWKKFWVQAKTCFRWGIRRLVAMEFKVGGRKQNSCQCG